MAKPGVIYRLNWQAYHSTNDVQCYVDISDTDNLIDDGDEEDIRMLTAGDPAVQMSVIDNDDNPFTTVRSQQLTIKFYSDYLYSMSTFCSGSDTRWLVHYYVGDDTKTVFKGYLNMDDFSEALLDPPNEVILTATDGLGLIKDIPLTNEDDTPLVGKYKISNIIAKCLAKTGLSLELRVAFNIKIVGMDSEVGETNYEDEAFISNVYLNVMTFETDPGILEDCRTILDKILGHESVLFQRNGFWWIVRVDEVEHETRGLYVAHFDTSGEFILHYGERTFLKQIGRTCEIKFSEESTIVKPTRPHKSVQLNYHYNTFAVPYNKEFIYGDFVSEISATHKRYTVKGWRLAEGLSSGPSCSAYIERKFTSYGTETERYLLLTSPVSPVANNQIISPAVEVGVSDKFDFSVDFATVTDMNGSGATYTQRVATIRVIGDDGTYWMLDSDGKWYQSNAVWSVNFKDIEYQFIPNNIDTTQYSNVSVTAEPIPVAGDLYIDLYAMNQQGSAIDDVDIKYSNLRFDYIPYVNGSYSAYKGQYHKSWQDGNYKASIYDSVYVSDSPKKLFRGAFQIIDSWKTVYNGTVEFTGNSTFQLSEFQILSFEVGMIVKISGTSSNNMTTRVLDVSYSVVLTTTIITLEATTTVEVVGGVTIETPVFVLANEFYNAAVYTGGIGGDETLQHSYGHLQVFDVWNQHNIEGRILQAYLQGADVGEIDSFDLPDIAGLINKWSPTDSSVNLVNRYFILLSYLQDQATQGWSGVFRQVVKLSVDKDYTNYEFKYLENG